MGDGVTQVEDGDGLAPDLEDGRALPEDVRRRVERTQHPGAPMHRLRVGAVPPSRGCPR